MVDTCCMTEKKILGQDFLVNAQKKKPVVRVVRVVRDKFDPVGKKRFVN